MDFVDTIRHDNLLNRIDWIGQDNRVVLNFKVGRDIGLDLVDLIRHDNLFNRIDLFGQDNRVVLNFRLVVTLVWIELIRLVIAVC